MSKIDLPHIYKKGKSLRIKNLDDPTLKKEYAFSSSGKVGVQTLANLCNNINQIVARCWLNTLKINHYFGIKKDISSNISKNNKPFNQFKKDLSFALQNRGIEIDNNHFEKLFIRLEKMNNTVEHNSKLLETFNKISKNFDDLLKEVAHKVVLTDQMKEFNLRLREVQNQTRQHMG